MSRNDEDTALHNAFWSEDVHLQEDPVRKSSSWTTFGGIISALLAMSWVGFCIWLLARRNFALPTPEQIPATLAYVAIPLILILVFYQLLVRSSMGEANRFTRIASRLRQESEALDMRLAIVNQQLDTARDAMREQAGLLENYGAAASINLESSAKKLAQYAVDSAQQATQIEQTGATLARQFGQLTEALPHLQERTAQMAGILTDGSNTLAEKVDRLEARLDSLVNLMDEARSRTLNATQSLTAQLTQIQDASRSAGDEVSGLAELSAHRIGTTIDQVRQALDRTGTVIDTQMADLSHLVERSHNALGDIGGRAIAAYGESIDRIEQRLRSLDQIVGEQSDLLSGIGDELTGRVDRASIRFKEFEAQGVSGAEKLANILDGLTQRTNQLDGALQTGNRTIEAVITRSESLLLALDASARELDESHPSALARLDDRIDQSRRLLVALTPEIERLEAVASAILGQAKESGELLTGQSQQLATWLENGEQSLASNIEHVTALHNAMEAADVEARRLSDSSGPQLVATLLRIRETADQAGERARHALSQAISAATDELGTLSEQALTERLGQKFQARMEEISTVADQAVKAAHAASDRLMRQLLTIADTTANIEARISEAEEANAQRDKENISNRSALLIESLNSISIDVAKLLGQDVSDSNWTTYLKGDRGVFTRHAVRLIDSGEARSISQLYDSDDAFHSYVNRYIHDFEAMLRNVLSARDGSALGVTLLSSDMGKLYVALAQAIDRLEK
ncbi:MAG: hypothetical protein E2598_11835 [Sphingobium sp.]|nr:hypothetical protein [Sphingobium sp.]